MEVKAGMTDRARPGSPTARGSPARGRWQCAPRLAGYPVLLPRRQFAQIGTPEWLPGALARPPPRRPGTGLAFLYFSSGRVI